MPSKRYIIFMTKLRLIHFKARLRMMKQHISYRVDASKSYGFIYEINHIFKYIKKHPGLSLLALIVPAYIMLKVVLYLLNHS